MKKEGTPRGTWKEIDWMITLVPLISVIGLCILFFRMPEQSNKVLSQIRFSWETPWEYTTW